MVGGAGTFRPLQFGGNGTELLNRPGSARKAPALLLLEKRIFPAEALGEPQSAHVASLRVRKADDSDTDWMSFFHGSGNGARHTHTDCPVYQRLNSKLGSAARKKSAFEQKQLGSEIMPPICEEQAVELMNYYYLVWLSKQNPQDEQLSMKVKSYGAAFSDSLISAREGAVGDQGRAQGFVLAMKKSAFRRAQDLASQKIITDEKIEGLQFALETDVSRLLQEEKEALGAIEGFYASKDARLAERVKSQQTPSQFLEKAKKLAAKIGIGIGTALTGLGTFFNDIKHIIKDVIEHIPLLSNVPPELVGAWGVGAIIGGWLMHKGFVKALCWHFEIIRGHLPKREAKKKAEARDKFDKLRDQAEHDFEVARKLQIDECASRHADIEQAFRSDFRHLLSLHGYVSPN